MPATTAIAADPVEETVERVLRLQRPQRVRPDLPITDAYLVELTARHEGIWCESTAEGELIISGASDDRIAAEETELARQVANWGVEDLRGRTRAMTGGFNIEGWGFKIPDVSWISYLREAAARPRSRGDRGYLPAAPEFIIEVRSPSDSLAVLQEKMRGWTSHGVLLGLMVDPQDRTVHIYRDGREEDILINPGQVSCEPEMPGLILDFSLVWKLADAPYDA